MRERRHLLQTLLAEEARQEEGDGGHEENLDELQADGEAVARGDEEIAPQEGPELPSQRNNGRRHRGRASSGAFSGVVSRA